MSDYYYSPHTVDIVDIQTKHTINIYPNPASDRIKIQIETLQPETVQMVLYDIVGRKISEISMLEVSQQFVYDMDVSNFAKGIYMLRIATSKGQVMRKIVIR